MIKPILYETALDDDGRLVHLRYPKNTLQDLSKSGKLSCPDPTCGKRLIYRCGNIVRAHFAHYRNSCNYRGESVAHARTKEFLRDELRKVYPDAGIEMEVYTNPLRPDVFGEIEDKALPLYPYPLAVEVQCSSLSLDGLEEKLRSNTSRGIYTMYVLDSGSGHYFRPHEGSDSLRSFNNTERRLFEVAGPLCYFNLDLSGSQENDDLIPSFEAVWICGEGESRRLRRIAHRKGITQFRLHFEERNGYKIARFEDQKSY